jgi:hypothetical protein
MAGFFSKLFGGSSSGGKAAPAKEHVQMIGDFKVTATPMREGAQFRLAGRIEKQAEGATLVRRFIRADLFSNEDDAVETTYRKAQQIINQQGPALFGDGAEEKQV